MADLLLSLRSSLRSLVFELLLPIDVLEGGQGKRFSIMAFELYWYLVWTEIPRWSD